MIQEINLLHGFSPSQKPFMPAELIVKIVIVLLLLLGTLQLIVFVEKQKLDKQLTRLTTMQDVRGNELLKLSNQLPRSNTTEDIQAQVDKLTKEISDKKNIVNSIGTDNIKFSDFMRSLGQRIIPGIWLKEIHINQQEHNIQILGRTLNPDLLPLFVAQLTKETPFKNVAFKQLKLAKPANQKLAMGFALRTIPDDENSYIFAEDASEEQKQSAEAARSQSSQGGIFSKLVNTFTGGNKGNTQSPSLTNALQKLGHS